MKTLFILIINFVLAGLSATDVTILAVSDTHGHISNLRYLAALTAHERKLRPDAILIDAGDTVQGTFEAVHPAGIPIRTANSMNVDLWLPGNHDFEILPHQFDKFKGTVLGANWHTSVFRPGPWVMLERNGYRIAVTGLTEANTRFNHLPEAGINVMPYMQSLDKVMPEIRKARPDMTILIYHAGLYFRGGSLAELLHRYPEIDLVIGGHTHKETDGQKMGRAWFVQPGKYGEALAVITAEFDDSTRQLVRIRSRLVRPRPDLAPAVFPPELEKAIKDAGQKAKERVKINRPFADCDSLIAGAMLAASGAECAIYSRSERHVFLPARDTISQRDIFRLMPYENRICTVRLTPDELRKIAGQECLPAQKNKRRTVFAGLQVRQDSKGNLLSLVHPEPDADGRISVAMCDYYIAGSGGASIPVRNMILSGNIPVRQTGILLRDAISAQLQRGQGQQ